MTLQPPKTPPLKLHRPAYIALYELMKALEADELQYIQVAGDVKNYVEADTELFGSNYAALIWFAWKHPDTLKFSPDPKKPTVIRGLGLREMIPLWTLLYRQMGDLTAEQQQVLWAIDSCLANTRVNKPTPGWAEKLQPNNRKNTAPVILGKIMNQYR